jgi:uncharacterized phage infection (PIP) family protein YhgE
MVIKKRARGYSTKRTSNINKILVENTITLQKIMADVADDFNLLNKKITKLLYLFEDAAKELAKKASEPEPVAQVGEPREIMEKLNTLTEQNKIIAKGLTLVHEQMPSTPTLTSRPPAQIIPRPSGYEKSITNKRQNIPV